MSQLSRIVVAVSVSNFQIVSSAMQGYHAGHAPSHVTRLHRYDHSGIDSMLQAEARWTQEMSGRSLKDIRCLRGKDVTAKRGQHVDEHHFVQLSLVQLHALQDHHVSWYSSDQETQKLEPRVHMVQNYSKDDVIATGLSSLSSQYVGPIGVGTKLTPPGCVPDQHYTDSKSGNVTFFLL
jgi:hypothetical protein